MLLSGQATHAERVLLRIGYGTTILIRSVQLSVIEAKTAYLLFSFRSSRLKDSNSVSGAEVSLVHLLIPLSEKGIS